MTMTRCRIVALLLCFSASIEKNSGFTIIPTRPKVPNHSQQHFPFHHRGPKGRARFMPLLQSQREGEMDEQNDHEYQNRRRPKHREYEQHDDDRSYNNYWEETQVPQKERPGYFSNVVIDNPTLDRLDPDGAYQRLPELLQDYKFWRDMAILFFFWLFCEVLPDRKHIGIADYIDPHVLDAAA